MSNVQANICNKMIENHSFVRDLWVVSFGSGDSRPGKEDNNRIRTEVEQQKKEP